MPDCTTGPRRGLARRRVACSAASLSILGLGLWPAALATSTSVVAKTPGKTYCFYRVCHRVMTLEETRQAVGKRTVVIASHYDDPSRDRFNPSNLTSSGEWFRSNVPDNAASPKLPNGTIILAWNPATKQSAVLRINNAGPYWGKRTLDVSRAAAERLGFARQGVATLHTQVIHAATRTDVAYKKGRRYADVPGHIGAHGSFELALAEAGRLMTTPLPIDPAPAAPATVVAAVALETNGPAASPALEPGSPSLAPPTGLPPLATAPALLGDTVAALAPATPPAAPAMSRSSPIVTASLPTRDLEVRNRAPFEARAVAGLRRLSSTLRIVPTEPSPPRMLAGAKPHRSPAVEAVAALSPAPRRSTAARPNAPAPVAIRVAALALPPTSASRPRTAASPPQRVATHGTLVGRHDDMAAIRPARTARQAPSPALAPPSELAPRRSAGRSVYVPAECRDRPLACDDEVPSARPVRSTSNRP